MLIPFPRTVRRPRAAGWLGLGFWGTLREALRAALDSLRSHRLRSFLTLLGIVIATSTLIVVMSVVNGMNTYIADHIANLGANTFVLHQFQWAQSFDLYLKARRRNQPIRIEDYDYLVENVRGALRIGAMAQLFPQPTVRYQRQVIDEVAVSGMTPSFVDIGREKVGKGRYLNEADYLHKARVCFIGQDVVEKLFPGTDPLDKELLIGGIPFRVIGAAERVGSAFGQSQDNFVMTPLTTFRAIWMARPELLVFVKAPDSHHMMELQDEVRALMRARRRVPLRDDDPFGINAADTLMSAWQRLTGTIFACTIGVVAVFMVVGGIVIMNIMLASVTERTHEIGILRSVGARRRDIVAQFLMEAAILSALGGLIGVLLAGGVAALVNMIFTAAVPLSAIVIGVVLSAAVGLFFGIYPARKAARLDPVDALRMET